MKSILIATHEGRLVIWNTECCFRDATGTWRYVTASTISIDRTRKVIALAKD